MKRRDLVFTVVLLSTLGILLYFWGASITGYISHSMYCYDGLCKEFCRFDTDCLVMGEVCCERGDFGVCEEKALCDTPFKYEPQAPFGTKISHMEMPSRGKTNWVFPILIILVVLIGAVYLFERETSKK